MCRTALDFMLNECLTVVVSIAVFIMGGVSVHLYIHQKGNHLKLEDQATDNYAKSTPTI